MSNIPNVLVLDLETTGFAANRHDRVIEIGIVQLDEHFQSIGSWSTLINPERDAGPKSIHGIEAKWLLDAPKFAEIAAPLAALLNGMSIVAHNAVFDINFLIAEFRRVGIEWGPEPDKIFDTMALAKSVVGEGASLKLADLCSVFSIENQHSHSALSDAIATTELLAKLILQEPRLGNMFDSATDSNWVNHSAFQDLSELGCSRSEKAKHLETLDFIPALVAALPLTGDRTADSLDYLTNLHLALEDFEFSMDEQQELTHLAKALGLSLKEVSEVHQAFFQDLVEIAWEDGLLTDSEWAQIQYVGRALGMGAIDMELAKTGRGVTSPQIGLPLGLTIGDAIVLTGDMVPSKIVVESMLTSAGLEVKGNISKKVRLLIAADADSQSGKASQARKLGISIISSELFLAQWSR